MTAATAATADTVTDTSTGTVTVTDTAIRSPARRRVLDTAARLFYAEGIHTVGVDRIIAEASVAKATFYHHFPAKDELVRAYLTEQSELQRTAVRRLRADEMAPLDMVFSVFEVLGEMSCGPGFRGCAFLNAAAEYPDAGHPVRLVIAEHRRWFRDLLCELLTSARHPDAERTADLLVVLRDGLVVGGYLDDSEKVRNGIQATVIKILTIDPH
jgi:AcrR family transcriptional regulator